MVVRGPDDDEQLDELVGDEELDEEDCLLLPFQREWQLDTSKIKVIAKARQVGITWTSALEAVLVASYRESHGGMDVYFMSMSMDDARQFIDDCSEWIRALTPALDELIDASGVQESDDWFEDDDGNAIHAYRIDFPSGYTIYALPSRPARFRGKKGFGIVDEAAQQDIDAIFRAASGLLSWGGRLAFISTYYGVNNEFYKLVRSIKLGDRKASLHEVFIHEALRDGLYKRICRKQGKEWSLEAEREWLDDIRLGIGDEIFDEEYVGNPSQSGGAIMSRALVEKCAVVPKAQCTIVEIRGGASPAIWVNGVERETLSEPWPLPSSNTPTTATATATRRDAFARWLAVHVSPALAMMSKTELPVFAGIDYGRTRNLTTMTFATKGRNGARDVGLIIELEGVAWPEQDAAGDFCWERLPTLERGCADSNSIGSNSAERARDRTDGKIACVRISDGWHMPAFQRVIAAFQAERLRIPGHFDPLIDDLTSIVKGGRDKIVIPERTTTDRRKQKRHADAAVSLALLEEAASSVPDPPPPINLRAHRRLRSIQL